MLSFPSSGYCLHGHKFINTTLCVFQDLVDELRRQRLLEERLPAAGDPRRPVLQRVLLQKRQSIEASLDQVRAAFLYERL